MDLQNILEICNELEIEIISTTSKGWLLVRCPFAEWNHNSGRDNNPDCFIKIQPDGYTGFHCFACKTRGSIISLIRQLGYRRDADYKSLYLRAAFLEVPENFGKFQTEAQEKDDYEIEPLDERILVGMYPLAWEDEVSRMYLEQRGISRRTAQRMGLIFNQKECRIMFPARNHKGELFGYQGRTVLEPEEYPYKKYPSHQAIAGLPKERLILGEETWTPGKPIFIIEGLFGQAHMMEIGADNIANVGATFGSDMSVYQRDIIASYNVPVFLCYDPDEAGIQGLFGRLNQKTGLFEGGGAIDKLKKHVPTFTALYPEGREDVDTFTLEDVKNIIDHDHELH